MNAPLDLGSLGDDAEDVGPAPAAPVSGMGAAAFLELVKPSIGKPVYMTRPYPRQDGTDTARHFTRTTPEAAAEHLRKLDQQGKDAYVAVLSFGNFEQAVGSYGPYEKITRKAENAVAARAWIFDLDVDRSGANPAQSLSPEAAIADLDAFCERHGLPLFTLNGSGNGVHAWLIVGEDITAPEWAETADQLAAVAKHDRLRVDPSCTTDKARVLRVPGTRNHKDPHAPRRVVNLRHEGVWSKAEVRARIRAAHDALPEADRVKPALPRAAGQRSQVDLAEGSHLEPPPVSKLRAVCPAYGEALATVKDQPEPVWRVLLCLTMHSLQGEAGAHELSTLHPKYDEAETQAKIDRLKAHGPFTCAGIEKIMGEGAPCKTCPHRGDATSPIHLARVAAREAVDARITTEDGTTVERPVILIEGGGIVSAVDQAEDALLAACMPIFQRGGKLVRPVEEEVEAADGLTTTIVRLAEITPPALIYFLAQVAEFQRIDGRSGKRVRIDPPRAVADVILSPKGSSRFPRVIGCVTAPTLRMDGSILDAPGYDSATGLYHARDPGLVLPAVPEAPTHAEAEGALDLLRGLLAEFPFRGPVDMSVAMCILMTPTLRGAMPVAPLLFTRAHAAGSGKSFLGNLGAVIATGRRCPAVSAGANEEELGKRLGAILLAGSPVVCLDNLTGAVGGALLCQAVEQRLVSIRPLGVSEMREVECKATVLANGNNAMVRGDMTRRTLICNIDAGVERPELRRFGFDPIKRILADRGSYVAAVLILARYARAHGGAAACPPLASYEVWSSLVRVPLLMLGMADPVASMEEARADDPELAAIRELFALWIVNLTVGQFYKANQIADAAVQRRELWEFLLLQFGKGGNVDTKALGQFLAGVHGRVVEGYKIVTRPNKKHGHGYALVKTGSG